MAENKDMQTEYYFFSDVWKLYKKYYDMPNEAEKWNEVIEASHGIEKRYNSQLCNDLLVAVIMELERKQIIEGENRQ